jgi:hypothetical protein
LPHFGTSTYFLLAMLALVDFLSGVALRARRGTQVASAAIVSRRAVRAPAAAPEPEFDPAPAPSAPAAVAESVPLTQSEPKILHSGAAPVEPSPEVPSPELQPGSGSSPSPDAPPR